MGNHVIVSTYEEALNRLKDLAYTMIAGGTDLMVKKRNWANVSPKFENPVLFISGIESLKYVKKEADGIHIGSVTTLEDILQHKQTPVILKKAIGIMASSAIRHTGTIGGNIGNASPAGDSLPILYVLNTKVVVESLDKQRVIAIQDFIKGPGKVDLGEDEIIKEIILDDIKFTNMTFNKVGGRKADAISKVAFCGGCIIEDSTIKDFRVAFGAVGPTIVRRYELDSQLINKSLIDNKDEIKEIIKKYYDYIRPIDDQRSTAVYRKQCTINLLNDFVENLF